MWCGVAWCGCGALFLETTRGTLLGSERWCALFLETSPSHIIASRGLHLHCIPSGLNCLALPSTKKLRRLLLHSVGERQSSSAFQFMLTCGISVTSPPPPTLQALRLQKVQTTLQTLTRTASSFTWATCLSQPQNKTSKNTLENSVTF